MYQLPNYYRWSTLAAPELAGRVRSRPALTLARQSTGALRVVLTGPPEAGKTSLAIALGREAMRRRDVNGMYVEAIELDFARAEARLGQAPENIHRASEVPVLVLDELGSEAAASKDVEQVIKRRYREGLQTIVVAALGDEAIGAGYSGGVKRRLEESVWIDCGRDRQPPAYQPPIRTLPARVAIPLPGPRRGAVDPDPDLDLETAMARIGCGGAR